MKKQNMNPLDFKSMINRMCCKIIFLDTETLDKKQVIMSWNGRLNKNKCWYLYSAFSNIDQSTSHLILLLLAYFSCLTMSK